MSKKVRRKKIGELAVFGQLWSVYEDPSSLGENYAGLCVFETQEILVNPGQTSFNYDVTVIHELIHSTFNRVSLAQAGVKPEVEEIICDTMATCLIENLPALKQMLHSLK